MCFFFMLPQLLDRMDSHPWCRTFRPSAVHPNKPLTYLQILDDIANFNCKDVSLWFSQPLTLSTRSLQSFFEKKRVFFRYLICQSLTNLFDEAEIICCNIKIEVMLILLFKIYYITILVSIIFFIFIRKYII